MEWVFFALYILEIIGAEFSENAQNGKAIENQITDKRKSHFRNGSRPFRSEKTGFCRVGF